MFVFICLSNAGSVAQAGAASSPPTAGNNSGQSISPSTAASPQIQQPEQPKASVDGAVKARQNATLPAPKTLELTDFQQFVAQSLGYVLPIYGASLFDNAPYDICAG